MKCRYCARTLRVIPHSPVEIEPHCERRGCCWCAECFRGETSVSPARPLAGEDLGDPLDDPANWPTGLGLEAYRPKHRRPEPGPGAAGERAA
jgi:hypothetical protein